MILNNSIMIFQYYYYLFLFLSIITKHEANAGRGSLEFLFLNLPQKLKPNWFRCFDDYWKNIDR